MYESVKNPFGRSSMFWGNDSDYYKFNEVIFPRKGSVSSPFLSHPFHSLACLSHSLSLPSLFSVFLSFIYTYTDVLITDFSAARHPLIFLFIFQCIANPFHGYGTFTLQSEMKALQNIRPFVIRSCGEKKAHDHL